MPIRLSATTCLFSFFSSISANQLYISVDQNGNRVYSDKPPAAGVYSQQIQTQIIPVKWVDTPKLKLQAKPKKKKSKANEDKKVNKKSLCSHKEQTIRRLQKKLKQRQQAQQFEQIKNQLSEQRARYRKQC